MYFNVLRYYRDIYIYIYIYLAPKNHAAWKMIRLSFLGPVIKSWNGVFPKVRHLTDENFTVAVINAGWGFWTDWGGDLSF